VYSEHNHVDETILAATNAVDHMDDFMEEEVENAIEWLKKGKADWGNAVIVPLY